MKQLKLLIFNLCIAAFPSYGQTALTAGDIAFIAYATDSTDRFAFLLLKDIQGSTELSFTDNGWLKDSALCTNEQTCIWTAPGGGLNKGTIIQITDAAVNASANLGTCTNRLGSLSASGDHILAYQPGPAFIAGISTRNWDDTCVTICTGFTAVSCLPAPLSNGNTAFCATGTTTDMDNGYYNGTLSGTAQQLLAAINNRSNWVFSNERQAWPSWSFALPVKLLSYQAEARDNSVILKWSTASEINNAGFEVERRDNTSGFQCIGKTEGSGNSSILNTYTFRDENPPAGTAYYLLKQVDFNGSRSDLGIICSPGKSTTNVNLVQEDLKHAIAIESPVLTDARFRLVNTEGEQVLSFSSMIGQGFNLIDIPVSQGGIYFLQAFINNEIFTFKIISRGL